VPIGENYSIYGLKVENIGIIPLIFDKNRKIISERIKHTMKVTSILKEFVEKYIRENFPVPYEMTSFEAFKKTLEEHVEEIYRRADGEALKFVGDTLGGVPEYEGVNVYCDPRDRLHIDFSRTEARNIYRKACDNVRTDKELIIARVLAEASSLKTIADVEELMDSLIKQYRD
jgi:hypothetical protein